MASKRIAGITIEIGGDASKLNKALAGVDKTISATATKLRDIDKLLKFNPGNSDLLIQKQKTLATEINTTKQRLTELKNAQQNALTTEQWDKLQSELKETDTNITGLKQKLSELKGVQQSSVTTEQWDKLQAEIKETEAELTQAKQKLSELKSVQQSSVNPENWDALQREIIETENKLKSLESEYRNFGSVGAQQIAAVGQKMQEIGNKISEFGGKVQQTGAILTAALTLPLAAIGKDAVSNFAEVDKTMNLTNQTMGNSEKQAKMLESAMMDAAKNSVFGMEEASGAVLNFARAGLDAEEAAAAIAPAMNLAAGEAGNLDVVSEGLVSTINGFGDSFDNTTKYADIFAAACNNSQLEIDSFSRAMSIASPVFHAAGYEVNDAALFMGVMADNGVKANKGANALKTGLSRLVDPPKAAREALEKLDWSITNTDGTMKSSVQIQKELHDKFSELSEAEQIAAASAIFGKNRMSEWLALINAAPEDVARLALDINGASFSISDFRDKLKENGVTLREVKDNMKQFGLSGKDVELALQASNGSAEEFIEYLTMMSDEGTTSEEIMKALGISMDDLQESMDRTSGTSEAMAKAMMEGFGGSLERLKSSADVASYALGKALGKALKGVIEKCQEAVDWFNNLDEAQQETVAKIGLVVAAIGPGLTVLGTLTKGLGGVVSGLGQILELAPTVAGALGGISAPFLVAVGVIAGAYATLWATNEEFRNNITQMWEDVRKKFEEAGQKITEVVNSFGFDFNNVIEVAKAAWMELCDSMAPLFEAQVKDTTTQLEGLADTISGIFEIIGGIVHGFKDGDWTMAWQGLCDIALGTFEKITAPIQGILEALCGYFDMDFGKIKEIVKVVFDFVREHPETAMKLLQQGLATIFDGIKEKIKGVTDGIKSDIQTKWNEIKTAISTLANGIKTDVSTIWNGIKTAIDDTINGIKSSVSNGWNAIKSTVSSIGNGIKSTVSSAWNSIKSSVINTVSSLASALQSKWSQIKSSASSAFSVSNFVSLGSNIVHGIIEGVENAASSLFNSLKNLAKEALEAAKDALDIGSPAKTFRDQVGKWIPAGMAAGIEMNTDSVTDAVKDMSDVALNSTTVPDSAIKAGNTTTTNYGGVNINVYAQDGQSAYDIAREVSHILNIEVEQQRAAFA